MEVLIVILMAAMMLVVFLATVGRYTHLYSIAWSEEFARYCMIGIVYFGLMLASRNDAHFAVEIVPLIFSGKKRILSAVAVIDAAIVDLFAVFLVREGLRVSGKMLRQGKVSPMLNLPLGAVYAVIPAGIALMAIFFTLCKLRKCRESAKRKEG